MSSPHSLRKCLLNGAGSRWRQGGALSYLFVKATGKCAEELEVFGVKNNLSEKE